jgi:phosphomannomutase
MKLLLFDVDGTLAESSQKISNEIKSQLVLCRGKGFEIGIVGGGRYEKILDQMDGLELDHIFAESGCVYYRKDALIYKKNIRSHSLYPYINIIIKRALEYLSHVDYQLTGHFIDLRNGIIYISLIGMAATLEERAAFLNLDRIHGYKLELLNILKDLAITMNIDKELVIVEGGSVGIGVYPIEWDKIQVLDSLPSSKYNIIHYFGDKYEPNGNDYQLLNHDRVIGHPINNPNECLDTLRLIMD